METLEFLIRERKELKKLQDSAMDGSDWSMWGREIAVVDRLIKKYMDEF